MNADVPDKLSAVDADAAADLEWRIMAPLALNQFRLWREGNMPVAFATWAYVDARVAKRLERGSKVLAPGEWKCGDKPVLIDLIAPFGGEEQAMKELEGVLVKG